MISDRVSNFRMCCKVDQSIVDKRECHATWGESKKVKSIQAAQVIALHVSWDYPDADPGEHELIDVLCIHSSFQSPLKAKWAYRWLLKCGRWSAASWSSTVGWCQRFKLSWCPFLFATLLYKCDKQFVH